MRTSGTAAGEALGTAGPGAGQKEGLGRIRSPSKNLSANLINLTGSTVALTHERVAT